jgi:hypothetical protein
MWYKDDCQLDAQMNAKNNNNNPKDIDISISIQYKDRIIMHNISNPHPKQRLFQYSKKDQSLKE